MPRCLRHDKLRVSLDVVTQRLGPVIVDGDAPQRSVGGASGPDVGCHRPVDESAGLGRGHRRALDDPGSTEAELGRHRGARFVRLVGLDMNDLDVVEAERCRRQRRRELGGVAVSDVGGVNPVTDVERARSTSAVQISPGRTAPSVRRHRWITSSGRGLMVAKTRALNP